MESMPEEKRAKSKKSLMIVIFILLVILVIILIDYLLNFSGLWTVETVPTCGDGTLYEECSYRKPYFCENGLLVEKASVCSCPSRLSLDGDTCVSQYQTNPKTLNLNYVLRAEKKSLDFTVYEGMINYISNLSNILRFEGDEQPSRIAFKLRNMNEKEQRELLLPLVTKIQNLADDKEEQARIAISLVQHISYGDSGRTTSILGGRLETNYSRYPYEVLYDNQGLCGEKSELLAFLLREIGYKVVFFYHAFENHESVGINCPVEYSLDKTGYCFVETTGPAIITDSEIIYVGGSTLESKPEVLFVSNGTSLSKSMYEYMDAKDLMKIRRGEFVLFKQSKFEELKEKYGLIEEYNLN